MEGFTIGKVTNNAGVGVETVRFYQRKGLIKQPAKPGSYGKHGSTHTALPLGIREISAL